jgi:hypothetical protein
MVCRIRSIFEECLQSGGILLAQPEHILSLKLATFCSLPSQGSTESNISSSSLLDLHSWLSNYTRDIIDESDEILHNRYQLIYTIGHPTPLEGHPDRWCIIQEVFTVMLEIIPEFPTGLEVSVDASQHNIFPTIRILDPQVGQRLLLETAQRAISGDRLMSLCIPKHLHSTAVSFITRIKEEQADYSSLRSVDGSKMQCLLLLRGLFAHGILALAFGQKRWRVDYGLDLQRSLMAVPFIAKDVPSLRSEYGKQSYL